MAYLLDTNVLSETVKAQPDPRVVAWLEETPLGEAYLSALTWGSWSRVWSGPRWGEGGPWSPGSGG
jgi:predicted nucleic acid-binding protein